MKGLRTLWTMNFLQNPSKLRLLKTTGPTVALVPLQNSSFKFFMNILWLQHQERHPHLHQAYYLLCLTVSLPMQELCTVQYITHSQSTLKLTQNMRNAQLSSVNYNTG